MQGPAGVYMLALRLAEYDSYLAHGKQSRPTQAHVPQNGVWHIEPHSSHVSEITGGVLPQPSSSLGTQSLARRKCHSENFPRWWKLGPGLRFTLKHVCFNRLCQGWTKIYFIYFILLFSSRLSSSHVLFSPSPSLDVNSDSGPLSRLLFPLSTRVSAFICIARRLQHFLPSSTRFCASSQPSL